MTQKHHAFQGVVLRVKGRYTIFGLLVAYAISLLNVKMSKGDLRSFLKNDIYI